MNHAMTRRRFLANTSKVAATAVATTLLPSSLRAQPRTGRHQRALAALDDYIREHMRAIGAPGMIVALAGRDGTLRVSHHGLADVKLRQPVRPQHLFEIGSISKSFAGICAVQLSEEGQLDLHAPVTKYLPELALDDKYASFTCHHLVSHTSGLAHDAPLMPNGPLKKLWSGFAPGTQYSYSNTGYQILGLVLEAIEKRSWAEIVRDRVFRPLGFNDSEPVITSRIRPRLATGYSPLQDDLPFPPAGELSEAPWVDLMEASGSIAATGDDMAKYVLMLLNRGRGSRGRVLSEEGFSLFVKPVHKAEPWGANTSYAYGLAVEEADDRTVLRHTGGMVAFSSAVHVDITNGFGAFASVNANLERYRPNAVARYAIDLLRASAKGERLPDPPAASGDPLVKPGDYTGAYSSPSGAEFSIEAASHGLVMNRHGKRIPLLPAGKDQFFVKDSALERFYLKFNREKDQVVEAFHGNDWYVHERYSGAKQSDYPKEWNAFAGHYRNDSPWWGSVRIFLRKGKLWLGNSDLLVPLAGGIFRAGEEEYSPERVSFDGVSNGHALKMNFSGVDFYRRPES